MFDRVLNTPLEEMKWLWQDKDLNKDLQKQLPEVCNFIKKDSGTGVFL